MCIRERESTEGGGGRDLMYLSCVLERERESTEGGGGRDGHLWLVIYMYLVYFSHFIFFVCFI